MTRYEATAPLVAAGLGVGLDGIAFALRSRRVTVTVANAPGGAMPAWARAVVDGAALDAATVSVEAALGQRRGLGEVAAGAAALAQACSAMRSEARQEPLADATRVALVRAAMRAEFGHPGTATAAAAVLERAVAGCGQEPYAFASIRVFSGARLAIAIPELDLPSSAVRAGLTATVTVQRALEANARAAVVATALASGDLPALLDATADRLMWQPFEASIPALYPALWAAREHGAASFVSGRGPAIACLADSGQVALEAAEAVCRAWRAHSVQTEVIGAFEA